MFGLGRLGGVPTGQNLIGSRQGGDAGRLVHASAGVVTPGTRRDGLVQADSHMHGEPRFLAMLGQLLLNLDRALHGV